MRRLCAAANASSLLKKSLYAQRDLKCAAGVFCLDGQGGSLS